MNQTTLTKNETVRHDWHIASAKGKVVGPLAVRVARALMGRQKADWTPSVDAGDFVVVTDVDGLVFTRSKPEKKIYRFHTGHMGGIVEHKAGDLLKTKPELLFKLAVRRMLPKTVQARHQMMRLKIYRGAAHPHLAQAPKPLP